MGDSQKDMLLGYLFGALEQHENELIESKLARDSHFRDEFFFVQQELQPLEEYAKWSQEQLSVPPDLASRTCRKLWDRMDSPSKRSANDEMLERSLQHALKCKQIKPDSGVLRSQSATSLHAHRCPKVSAPRKTRRWIDNLPSLLVGALIALLLFSAIQYGKDYMRHAYTRDMMNKIGKNSAVSAQLRDQSIISPPFFPGSFMLESEQPIHIDYSNSGIGGLLANFGEASLSSPLLFLHRNGKVVLERPKSNRQAQLSEYSGLSAIGFQPFTFESQSALPTSRGLPYALLQHQQVTGILSERGKGAFAEPLFDLGSEQNTFYQDNRVFFRRIPK